MREQCDSGHRESVQEHSGFRGEWPDELRGSCLMIGAGVVIHQALGFGCRVWGVGLSIEGYMVMGLRREVLVGTY